MRKIRKEDKHMDMIKLTAKELGITASGYFKIVKEICKKAMDNNKKNDDKEDSKTEHERIIDQENLISCHLRLIREDRKLPFFKSPNIEQFHCNLGFYDLFSEDLFGKALSNLIDREEICIRPDQNGIHRVYEWEYYDLIKKAPSFYNILHFIWKDNPHPNYTEIWDEFNIIEGLAKRLSKKKFIQTIRLLENKLLIVRLEDGEGRVIIVKNNYSQKTRENILNE